MSEQAALPAAEQSAEASAQQLLGEQSTQHAAEGSPQEGQAVEGEGGEQAAKKEKSPEQREIERLRRGLDRKHKQAAEARAELDLLRQQGLRPQANGRDNSNAEGDDEPVTLSRAELRKIEADAERRGLSSTQQQAEIERRAGIVEGLQKDFGRDKFDALAKDLNDAFDGLADSKGRPKQATDAIFESADPKALIEYLADPENADEADVLSRMTDRQLGRAMARLEDKVAALKKDAKPQPSKAAAPIEAGRGSGNAVSAMPDPSNTKAYIKWANEQERRGSV